MDQFSFEEGLKLGINSARIVVEQDGVAALRAFEEDTKAMIKQRRNGGITPARLFRRMNPRFSTGFRHVLILCALIMVGMLVWVGIGQ